MASTWFGNFDTTPWYDTDTGKYMIYFIVFLLIVVLVFTSIYTYFLIDRCYNLFSKEHNIKKCCQLAMQNVIKADKTIVTEVQFIYNGHTNFKKIDHLTMVIFSPLLVQTTDSKIADRSVSETRGTGKWSIVQKKNNGNLDLRLDIDSLDKGAVHGLTISPALPNNMIYESMYVKTN